MIAQYDCLLNATLQAPTTQVSVAHSSWQHPAAAASAHTRQHCVHCSVRHSMTDQGPCHFLCRTLGSSPRRQSAALGQHPHCQCHLQRTATWNSDSHRLLARSRVSAGLLYACQGLWCHAYMLTELISTVAWPESRRVEMGSSDELMPAVATHQPTRQHLLVKLSVLQHQLGPIARVHRPLLPGGPSPTACWLLLLLLLTV